MPDLVNRPLLMDRMTRFWRAFRNDIRGVSAVEFALIAPVMIVFYFGMAEATQAMMAQRRVSNIASSIGDLTAQSAQLTDARRTDIFTIGNTIMAPFSTSTLRMCLVSVSSDSTGKDTVDWTENYNSHGNCPTKGTVLASSVIPTSVLAASQSVIMAKTSYVYTPATKFLLPSGMTFYRTFYLRPRKSDKVMRVTG